jgi:hypothetical protein
VFQDDVPGALFECWNTALELVLKKAMANIGRVNKTNEKFLILDFHSG